MDKNANDSRNFALNEFTPDDKRASLPTVELLIKVSEMIRTGGILSIAPLAQEADTLFLEKAIEMLYSGLGAEAIKEVLQTYILSSSYKGADLLRRILIIDGMCMVANGENTYWVRERLLARFGEEFYEEARRHLGI